MFFCSFQVLKGKEIPAERNKPLPDIIVIFFQAGNKSRLQAIMMSIVMPEVFDEIIKIIGIEGPVLEVFKTIKVRTACIQAELMGAHIHPFHQFPGFIYDGCAIPPGENGSKKSRDLDILFFTEKVRNTYRVIDNERLIAV